MYMYLVSAYIISVSLVHHGGYPIKLLILPQIIARFGSRMHPEPVNNTEYINTKTSNKMVLQM